MPFTTLQPSSGGMGIRLKMKSRILSDSNSQACAQGQVQERVVAHEEPPIRVAQSDADGDGHEHRHDQVAGGPANATSA